MPPALRLSIASLCILFFSTTAYAGAWTQQQGNGLLIMNHSYYYTDRFINNYGKKQSQPAYQKFELNPYLEYGISDTLTVGANIFLQYIRQNSSQSYSYALGPYTTVTTTLKGTQNNVGIGDSEFFLRKQLWKKDGFVLSLEPMFKAPSLVSYTDLPAVGNSRPDAGLGLSGGYGFKAYGQNHFVNIDTQYRYRFGKQKDQVRLAATVGISLDEQWMIMPQLFITRRTASPSPGNSFNENPSNDYNLTKIQISAIYKMWDDTAVQVGGFYHVDARNSSLGGGILISLWEHF